MGYIGTENLRGWIDGYNAAGVDLPNPIAAEKI
jgi:hypothetical protein